MSPARCKSSLTAALASLVFVCILAGARRGLPENPSPRAFKPILVVRATADIADQTSLAEMCSSTGRSLTSSFIDLEPDRFGSLAYFMASAT